MPNAITVYLKNIKFIKFHKILKSDKCRNVTGSGGQGNLPVTFKGSNLVINLAGPMLSMQSSV